MNEEEQLLKEITGEDVFDQNLMPATEETPEEEPKEDTEQILRNRRERRLAEKLEAEKASSIELAARLKAITEARQTTEDPDYMKSVDRIYGTDTPEALAATDLLKNALKGMSQQAKEDALEAFREEQRQAQAEQRQAEESLDQMVEDIEDKFNVLLTKDQQKGFFTLLERLSPKDSSGNILQYADPVAVYEEYQERMKRSTGNKAKELASRSMTQSGAGSSNNATADAEQQFLRSEGII